MNKIPPGDIVKQIDEYLKGRLDKKETDELWEYMLENPEFYKYLKIQAGLRKKQMDDKNDPGNKPGKMVKEDKKPWLVALAAVILITLMFNFFRSGNDAEINPVTDSIPLAYLITPEVERSSDEALSVLESRLMDIYFDAVSGSAENAIAQYEELVPQADDTKKQTIYYNLGVLNFNAGNYTASAHALENVGCEASFNNVRADRCLWIKMNSFLAVDDRNEATVYAQKLAEISSSYQEDAINLLGQINSQTEE